MTTLYEVHFHRAADGSLELTIAGAGAKPSVSRGWLTYGALCHFAARMCREGSMDSSHGEMAVASGSGCRELEAVLIIERGCDRSLAFRVQHRAGEAFASNGWITFDAMFDAVARHLVRAHLEGIQERYIASRSHGLVVNGAFPRARLAPRKTLDSPSEFCCTERRTPNDRPPSGTHPTQQRNEPTMRRALKTVVNASSCHGRRLARAAQTLPERPCGAVWMVRHRARRPPAPSCRILPAMRAPCICLLRYVPRTEGRARQTSGPLGYDARKEAWSPCSSWD